MELFREILFWLGILGLVDGSLGLLFKEKMRKMDIKWNVQKVALIEIAVASALVAAHFALSVLLY